MFTYLQIYIPYSTPILKESASFVRIYFFWSLMHYIIGHLYHKFCIPDKFYKIFFTPFYTQNTHCKSLYWLYETSVNTISSISATMITWSSKFLMDNMSANKIYKKD